MSKKLEEVVDAAGVTRNVRSVDAREIEAAVLGGPSESEPVAEPEVKEDAKATKAFPDNFPGTAAFEAAGISHHQTLRMTRDELLEVKGIGEGTADAILKLRK